MKMATRTSVNVALVCVVSLSLAMQSTQPAPKTASNTEFASADSVLDKMRKVYSDCMSYQDEGTTVLDSIAESETREPRDSFRTCFVRNDKFRYEYRGYTSLKLDQLNHIVIWAKGKSIKSWWSMDPKIKEDDQLGFALVAHGQATGGSAGSIASLLLPQSKPRTYFDKVRAISALREGSIDGEKCFVVDARITPGPKERSYTLWIDAKLMLIRRIVVTLEMPEIKQKSVTTHHIKPRINVEIPDREFDFEPPSAEKIGAESENKKAPEKKP